MFWTSAGDRARVHARWASRCSWPLAAFYGEPEVQPLFAALSLSFIVTALGHDPDRAADARDELQEPRAADDGRDGRRRRRRHRARRARATGRGRSSASSSPSPSCRPLLLWAFSPVAPAVHVLAGQPALARRLQPQRVRDADRSSTSTATGQRADRALPRARRAGRLRGRLQRHAGAAEPARGADRGGVLRRRSRACRTTPSGSASLWLRANRLVGALTIPGMLGLVRRRAGVRPGGARGALERRGAGDPDPRLGRPAAVPAALNSSILQARDRTRHARLPLLGDRAHREPDRVRGRA